MAGGHLWNFTNGLVMRNAMGRTYQDVWFAYNENPIRNSMHYIILVENGSFRKGFCGAGNAKTASRSQWPGRCVAAVWPLHPADDNPDSDDLPHCSSCDGVPVNDYPEVAAQPASL